MMLIKDKMIHVLGLVKYTQPIHEVITTSG